MSGTLKSYMVENWKSILNSLPFGIWIFVGACWGSFCLLRWNEWVIRSQLDSQCLETVREISVIYLCALPIVIGWMWSNSRIQSIKSIDEQ